MHKKKPKNASGYRGNENTQRMLNQLEPKKKAPKKKTARKSSRPKGGGWPA